jgi:hypothetical protein
MGRIRVSIVALLVDFGTLVTITASSLTISTPVGGAIEFSGGV